MTASVALQLRCLAANRIVRDLRSALEAADEIIPATEQSELDELSTHLSASMKSRRPRYCGTSKSWP
jgi:hypothetical protein